MWIVALIHIQKQIDNKFCLNVNQSYGEINPKLRINGGLEASVENPLYVTNSTTHTNYWTLATFHQLMANSGSWIQFSRDGTSNTWQTGMSSDNSYVIRVSDVTTCLTVNQNGNTTISGNLDAQRLTLNKPSNDSVTPLKITNNNQNCEVFALESTIAGDGCLQSF